MSCPTSTPADIWKEPRKILVVLAHPDDPEFFCGATLAGWARAGHSLSYCLLTCGEKGASDPALDPEEICRIRRGEQAAAAAVIGARDVHFLDLPDGGLEPGMELRRKIVRVIRAVKPDVLVTCDPSNLYPSSGYGINHPDHRYAGQAALDAAYPAVGNARFFPELLQEGLPPHSPEEVWISLPTQADIILDVTATWPVKVEALLKHASQIGEREAFIERILSRRTADSTAEDPRYEERFRRILLRRR